MTNNNFNTNNTNSYNLYPIYHIYQNSLSISTCIIFKTRLFNVYEYINHLN